MILQYPVRLPRRPYYLGASIFRAGTDIRRDSLYSFLTKLNSEVLSQVCMRYEVHVQAD